LLDAATLRLQPSLMKMLSPSLLRMLVTAIVPLAGCGAPAAVHVEVTRGKEADAFTADPHVTVLETAVIGLDGSVLLRATAAPGGSFDLGEIPDNVPIHVEVTGKSQTGAVVLRGRSLTLDLSGGKGGSIPVFVERLNRWARPPGGLLKSHVGAPAGVLNEQVVFVAGGEGRPSGFDGYDLFGLGGGQGSVPRVPETIFSFGSEIVFLDPTGATSVTAFGESGIAAPAGITFTELSGGKAVETSDGRVFVVGATRSGKATAPTGTVLVIGADGTVSAASLLTPRAGASAIWVPKVGLVVAGGSASGAGVEVLAEGQMAFAAQGYEALPVVGAAAALTPEGGMVLLGGVEGGAPGKTRLLSPICVTAACSATVVTGASLPEALDGSAAFALGGRRFIVVGERAASADHPAATLSFLVDLGKGSVTELGLREPRRGASVIPTPTGGLALLGGAHADGTPALSVELLFPE
jgi:hypothetical protein